MKLLFDQNLSPQLCAALRDLWPDIIHVRDVGLHSASDSEVWAYAAKHGLTIVTKDSDFNNFSFLLGAPPKVVWVGLGNCATRDVEVALRLRCEELVAFLDDPQSAVLVIGPSRGEGDS